VSNRLDQDETPSNLASRLWTPKKLYAYCALVVIGGLWVKLTRGSLEVDCYLRNEIFLSVFYQDIKHWLELRLVEIQITGEISSNLNHGQKAE